MNQIYREILFLNPVCTHNIWGGSRLRDEFGYSVDGNYIGECWGISAHPNGDGTVQSGTFAGKKLSEMWKEYPEMFGKLQYDCLPIMTKIIDAREDLSIQVHPNDEYAKVYENSFWGKTECWYILDCPENASLVMGHNAKSKEELRDMIYKGRWRELLREIPVKKGDFIQIDPGTIHAVKRGILLLETQQNSNITYRIYDYDRKLDGKARELHVEKSIDVITVPSKTEKESVKNTLELPENQLNKLYSCVYYDIFKLVVNGKTVFNQQYPFLFMSILDGEGTINGQSVMKGNHFILPCGLGIVNLYGKMTIIASTVQRKL